MTLPRSYWSTRRCQRAGRFFSDGLWALAVDFGNLIWFLIFILRNRGTQAGNDSKRHLVPIRAVLGIVETLPDHASERPFSIRFVVEPNAVMSWIGTLDFGE